MKISSFVVFLAVAFGITVPLFYFAALQTSPIVVPVVLLIGSYAPALGAWIAVSREGGDAKQSFRLRLKGWGGGRWIGWALLLPSLIWLLAFAFEIIRGTSAAPVWAALAAIPVILLVNYGEEVGWRGYALPYLMQHLNAFTASLVLGIIWALFHAALYWQRPVFGLLASMTIILISVILAWMFVNTNTILPGTVFHAVFNAWTQVFAAGENGQSILVVVIVLLMIVAGALFIRYRKDLKLPL